jgi:hypothetical protein
MIAAKRKAMRRLLKSRHCSPIATDTIIAIDIPIETDMSTGAEITVVEEIPIPAIAIVVEDGGGGEETCPVLPNSG